MIRLIASDMDGTLLNSAGYITKHTANIIQKIQKSGIEFIVNTGREYHSAKRELDAASVCCDMICYGGACTYDQFGNPYHITPIPKSIARAILQIFESHNVFADISTDYGKSSISDPEHLLSYYNHHVLPAAKLENKVYFKTQEDFDDMTSRVRYFADMDSLLGSETPIYKISTTFIDPTKIEYLKKEIEHLTDLHITSTAPTNIEVTHVRAQKGYALLQYAQTRSILPSEILAVGDSENDRSMLSLDLGITAAMANAPEAIQRICSAIAPSNDQDGVAALMENILYERSFYETKHHPLFIDVPFESMIL